MATRATRPRRKQASSVRFASGATVRRIRLETGMGVRELGRRVGCSPSLISRIESGTVAPSVQSLYAIAKELGVSVDELLEQDGHEGNAATEDARAGTPFDLVRKEGDTPIALPVGVSWGLLAGNGGNVEFREVCYEPGAMSSPPGEFLSHPGTEYGYVVEGQFVLEIGAKVLELSAGDSVSLVAQSPHRLSNPGKTPARAVWLVTTRPGDPAERLRNGPHGH